jgi:hypothetical protein
LALCDGKRDRTLMARPVPWPVRLSQADAVMAAPDPMASQMPRGAARRTGGKKTVELVVIGPDQPSANSDTAASDRAAAQPVARSTDGTY